MISLPNGCRCSDISVIPQNWNDTELNARQKKELIQKKWRIFYRFYDPTIEKPGLIRISAGINYIKDLSERRAVVKDLIAEEYKKLKELGYNPITQNFVTPLEIEYEIDPDTEFIKALEKAKDKLDVSHRVKVDMKAAIKVMKKAAVQLRFDVLPIQKISIRHLTMLLDRCAAINPKWSARRHNMFRSYLIMLFKKLSKLEASTGNPARDLDKKKEFKKIKAVLTNEQRNTINTYLKENDYRFWCFIHLFFHSGARLTELVQVRKKDVDLEGQTYTTIIRKGTNYKEVQRTIKDVALPYWTEFVQNVREEDYLFGIDFLPKKKPMVPDTITRRWQRLIKIGLGIDKDLYSLKHLNTTETVDQIGSEGAALQNAHEGTQMVNLVYDVKRIDRKHEQLKKVNNKFA